MKNFEDVHSVPSGSTFFGCSTCLVSSCFVFRRHACQCVIVSRWHSST